MIILNYIMLMPLRHVCILIAILAFGGVIVWGILNYESSLGDTPTATTPLVLSIKKASPFLDTSTWSTCRNVKAGYEVKYPSSWSVYGDGSWENSHSPGYARTTPCIGLDVGFFDHNPGDGAQNPQGLHITISSLADFESRYLLEKPDKYPPITIDGYEFRVIQEYTQAYLLVGFINEKVYSILPHEPLDKETFQTILSTFHLL